MMRFLTRRASSSSKMHRHHSRLTREMITVPSQPHPPSHRHSLARALKIVKALLLMVQIHSRHHDRKAKALNFHPTRFHSRRFRFHCHRQSPIISWVVRNFLSFLTVFLEFNFFYSFLTVFFDSKFFHNF